MSSHASPTLSPPAAEEGPPASHLLGTYDVGRRGPMLVAVGGLHGNEPSGVAALRRVLSWLETARPELRGRFLAVAGNLSALAVGERFLDEDLNRVFQPERTRLLDAPERLPDTVEAREQVEILRLLHEEFSGAAAGVFFLDLHTSSARGEPFVCIGDTLRNRRFALQFPVPVILGLEEQVDGALLEHVNNLGHVTMGVEAGQHDHPESVDHHEAFVSLALIAAGCLRESEVPRASEFRRLLRGAAGDLPAVLEVRYRHAITPDDGFEMRPGYSNFQHVENAELLATDVRGELRAQEKGRMLLPLYQGLGNDGYFLVREIRPFWLRVSSWMRYLRLGRLAHWLPGVRRSPDEPRTLHVDAHVARWYTVEIFHLLGFRKERSRGETLVFSRREE